MKRNEGYTLVELMVVILVAAIVMAAGTTVLLMGIRMHKASTEQATRQINTRIVLSALEELASETEIQKPEVAESGSWWVRNGAGKPIFSYNADAESIFPGEETTNPLLTEVTDATVDLMGTLLTITVTIDGTEYTSSVYCRLVETTSSESGGENVQTSSIEAPSSASSTATFSLRSADAEFLSTNWLAIAFADQRQNFLSVLEAEEGSTGASVTTGEYFSEWYIGGYEGAEGWNKDTPWCACFVSWALAKCSDDLMETPRFAHVNEFMNSFSLGFWRTKDPSPGDIIFFDWTPDAVTYAQHVGVVVSAEDGYVKTIEGNADGRVAYRVYEADDPCILGYGVLKWK